jgi:hypothetical protein
MSKTVTIAGGDGQVVITKTDDGTTAVTPPTSSEIGAPVVIREHHRPFDGGLFLGAFLLGMIALFLIQSAMRVYARREARSRRDAATIGPQEDRMAAEVAALARRTATLETIVTDPAQRTAREIDALR